MKRFALTHLGGTALAFGILVSSLTAAATLSLTGDLPAIGSGGSAHVADSGLTTSASATDAERRQLSMERNDFDAWRKSLSPIDANIAEQRQLAMERNDFYEWRKSLALDRDGADIVPAPANVASDITRLNLDRDGADRP